MVTKFINKLIKVELVRTGFWTGISSIISTISVFLVQKIIAMQVGPAGLAVFSQFQNFIGISSSLAGAGINGGTTRYIAEFKNDKEKSDLVISTSTKITFSVSLFFSLLILLFTPQICISLFGNTEYKSLLIIFAVSLLLYSLNSLLIAILNGFNEVKKFIGSSISRSIFILLLTIVLTYFLGLYGALLSIAIVQSLVFFVSLFFVLNSKWFSIHVLAQRFDLDIAKKLFAFSLVGLSGTILPPLLNIGVRNFITDNISIVEAGYWDAMTKLSQGYFSILSLIISVYFLPKFASIKDKVKLKEELYNGYKIIVPFFLFIILFIYTFDEYIILILYTSEFLPVKNLILPFLIGDLFKVMFGVLGVLMSSKSNIKMYILMEVGFTLLNYLLTIYFIDLFGIVGGAYSHSVRTLLRLIISFYLVKRYILK